MIDWPLIEQPLVDHLDANTTFTWTNEGGHLGTGVPKGIVQRSGGTSDLDLEDIPDVEITIIAATRAGVWQMAQQVQRVFAGLNPGGIVPDDGDPIYVDEVTQTFAFVVDPDRGTSSYRVATATYSLTLRPQGDEEPIQP